MTFTAAHSDIWGALGLNCFGEVGQAEGGCDEEASVGSGSRSGSDHGGDEGRSRASGLQGAVGGGLLKGLKPGVLKQIKESDSELKGAGE